MFEDLVGRSDMTDESSTNTFTDCTFENLESHKVFRGSSTNILEDCVVRGSRSMWFRDETTNTLTQVSADPDLSVDVVEIGSGVSGQVATIADFHPGLMETALATASNTRFRLELVNSLAGSLTLSLGGDSTTQNTLVNCVVNGVCTFAASTNLCSQCDFSRIALLMTRLW